MTDYWLACCNSAIPDAAAKEEPSMPFCKNCGSNVAEGARFCASCGTETGFPVASVPGGLRRPLTRPKEGRQIAGVCKGLSLTYGWDVTVVRIVAILLGVVCFPVGEIAYIVAWVVMPEEPLELPTNSSMPSVGN
jgi:phage shock protein C